MNPYIALILGLLVGWLVEWVIDWLYWRRKASQGVQPEGLKNYRRRVADLEREIESYQSQLAILQEEKQLSDRIQAVQREAQRPAERAQTIEQPRVRDNLEEIKGITPEMARHLNGAGILCFADLGALRPQQLKDILGGLISQPGGQVEIVKQARLASGMIKKVDDLEVISGIGPVIARTLNDAGIFTFADLAALTARDLRVIVGERIQRLADEDSLLSQARQLAEAQNQGG